MKKPEFNDRFAKEKMRKLNSFGGKTVEILYGAKDAQGNPCAPAEDSTTDGHGCWFGMENNGEYTMFSWQHSAEEGGTLEYGTEFEDHAMDQMIADLDKKKDICQRAEYYAREYEGTDAEDQFKAVKAEFEAVKDWGTARDKELAKRFARAEASYAPRVEAMKTNREAKEKVMEKVDEIKNMTNFKQAAEAVRKLQDELHEIGSAGQKADEEFSSRLKDLSRDISTRRKEYFDNLDANREAAKAKKTEIIAKANDIVKNVTNWKNAGAEMDQLFADWKTAGSAGHDEDDALWAEYNRVRDQFYAGRKAFFDERRKQWNDSVSKKKALIEEAKRIADLKDYSRENTEKMKQLDKDWKAAGYSGREQNDKLFADFNTAKEGFWGAKKAAADQRTQKEIDYKNSLVERIKGQIEDLQDRLDNEDNASLREGFEQDLYVAKNKLENLEEEIRTLAERLRK